VPELERLIRQHGKIRVLVQMHEFHGWTMGALWEDIKFDLKHFAHIERLALVGDSKWEAGMAAFCRPFTTAAIRFFYAPKADEAHQWISEGAAQPA
jgi:SpoIIAA-like